MESELTRLRTRRGLTLRELARLVDAEPSTLSRWEQGKVRSPSPRIISALAAALQVTPSVVEAAIAGRPPGRRGFGQKVDPQLGRLAQIFDHLEAPHRQAVLTFAEQLHAATVVRTSPVGPGEIEPAHYVHGWRRETVEVVRDDPDELWHLAGAFRQASYRPIRAHDVIWIVFVEAGRLFLFGRMTVSSRGEWGLSRPDEVFFSMREARKLLGVEGLFEATDHLLCVPDSVEKLREIKVPQDVVKRLAFRTSQGPSRVAFQSDGGIAGQAFRRLRLLDRGKDRHLAELWSS